MENLIYYVLNDISEYLNISRMKSLQEFQIERLVEKNEYKCEQIDNLDYLDLFLSAKHIEGCTDRNVNYYQSTLFNMFKEIKLPLREITTEVIRAYLIKVQSLNNCGKTTLDNVR